MKQKTVDELRRVIEVLEEEECPFPEECQTISCADCAVQHIVETEEEEPVEEKIASALDKLQNFTPEIALQESVKLWVFLAETGEEKENWPGWEDYRKRFGHPVHWCPLCQWAQKESGGGAYDSNKCHFCLVDWTDTGELVDWACERGSSPFLEWGGYMRGGNREGMKRAAQKVAKKLIKALEERGINTIVTPPLLTEQPLLAEFRQVCAKVLENRHDYNLNGVQPKDYWLNGPQGLMQMVWTKTLRLRSLVGSPGEVLEDKEKIKDTCVDLANYAGFMWELLK